MKRMVLPLLALVLSAAVLLSGCGILEPSGYLGTLKSILTGDADIVPFESMEYTRPDMAQFQEALDSACQTITGEDADAALDAVFSFYDAYDWFYTCYSLADIHYCADLTDLYWEEEYSYCLEHSPEVDAALEELYYCIAQSPNRDALEAEYFGEGFFESYDGENVWDETLTEMLSQEAQLQSQYYALSEQALDFEYGSAEYYDACADDMAQLLADLVKLRQDIAAYWGYSDYTQFAFDYYYYRDYTPAEMASYLAEIRQQLVPLYRSLNETNAWTAAQEYCTEAQTLDYVRETAQNMGGIVQDAFDLMESGGLYNISYGENKYSASFEVYLFTYWEPFIFINPTMTAYDQLVFVHEFGHFCNDYASYGSYVGVDVSEIFSQGMEYLSLCYTENSQGLTRAKMADSLCLFVEQAAFAEFEQRLYAMPQADLTPENIYALYDEIALSYGFDSYGYDRREFVDITHFYTNPLYIIGYVTSNDAAMQLYQLEQQSPGAGKQLFEENLTTEESYLLAFLDSAGLESPFAEGRIDAVRKTFEEIFAAAQ